MYRYTIVQIFYLTLTYVYTYVLSVSVFTIDGLKVKTIEVNLLNLYFMNRKRGIDTHFILYKTTKRI